MTEPAARMQKSVWYWLLGVRGRIYWLMPPALVALCMLVALWEPVTLQVLRHTLFDQYQRWQPRPYTAAPVRIIDIDDESLRRFGQWPWPRTRLAELTQKLQSAQPAVVAYDMLFAEPDRTSPQVMLGIWQLSGAARAQVQALPDHDQVLASVLANGPVVLGLSLERASQPGQPAAVKTRFVTVGEAAQPYLHAFSGAINPLPQLAESAAGLGAMTFVPDADGVVRRVALLVRVGDALVPTLATETLRVAQGVSNVLVRSVARQGVGVADVRIGQLTLPTTDKGGVWVHYSQPEPARTIAAWKVLEGQVSAAELAGKLLLVGTSAQGLMDLRFTPLGAIAPGVEIHAQLLEQVLTGGGLTYPSWSPALQIISAAAAGLTMGYIALSAAALVSLAWFVGLSGLLAAAAWAAFSRYGLLIDAVVPLLTLLVCYGSCSVVHHLATERRQRWIRQAFSRYVSPNLVNYLIKQPGALELGGRRQECSFVFTDLTGFTTMIEGMDPGAAVSLLNDYLDGMIAIVFAHQGTLDRIVGDALVIMFSAPVVQPDHRARALRCAWEMHLFSERYVADLAGRGIHFGTTRIGVHSGEVIVGNFGGKTIFDYRALGDPINAAARLETANKHFGTLMCVSQATLSGCPEWPVRPIGKVLFKGKLQWLQVFEPLAPDAAADAQYLNAMNLLHQGQAHAALAAFETLARRRAHDPLVALHLQRLRAGQADDAITLSEK